LYDIFMIRTVSLMRPLQRRAGTVVFAQKSNTIATVPKNWMERLFNVPKGWEKFYRKPGGKAEQAETGASSKTGPKVEKKPSGGNGGNGGSKKPDDEKMMARVAASMVALGIVVAMSDMTTSGR
jgi:hypothetical protein